MLIVIGGLPGTGKTTIGSALAAKRSAAYLRVDEIEHALRIRLPPGQEIGPEGYIIAQAVALSNLRLGTTVVADCVNPVPESRQGWRDAARKAGARILEIEIVCSDRREHQRRVESRIADIDGFALPDWVSVLNHHYVAWTGPRLILDTAVLSPKGAVERINAQVNAAPMQ